MLCEDQGNDPRYTAQVREWHAEAVKVYILNAGQNDWREICLRRTFRFHVWQNRRADVFSGRMIVLEGWKDPAHCQIILRAVLQEGFEEAIYIQNFLTEMCPKAIYIQNLLTEMCPSCSFPIHAFVDNKSLVEALGWLVDDHCLHITIGALKETLQSEVHSVSLIPGTEQLANVMTKRGASGATLLAVFQNGKMVL